MAGYCGPNGPRLGIIGRTILHQGDSRLGLVLIFERGVHFIWDKGRKPIGMEEGSSLARSGREEAVGDYALGYFDGPCEVLPRFHATHPKVSRRSISWPGISCVP